MKAQTHIGLSTIFFVTSLFSIFQGAAINLSDFSLQAGILAASVFVLLSIFSRSEGNRKIVGAYEYSYLKYLVPFVFYASASAFLMPFFFQGLTVFVPRKGITIAPNGTLDFGISNVAQALNLIFDLTLFVSCIRLSGQSSDKISMKLFQTMGFLALSFSLYQFASDRYGLYYPSAILNSNQFGAQEFDTTINEGVYRISGVFSEASYNGNFLGMFFVFYVCRMVWQFTLSDLIFVGLFLVGTAITTSSLGYIEIGFGMLLLPLLLVNRIFRTRKLNKGIFFSLPAFGFLLFSTFLVSRSEITTEILEKNQGISYLSRSASDIYSYDLLLQTFGLGVGLGGNRPSSFTAYLLSNVGIPGTALFVLFLIAVIRPYFSYFRSLNTDQRALIFAFFSLLLGKLIAVPDLSFTYFWIILATLALQFQTPRFRFETEFRERNKVS